MFILFRVYLQVFHNLFCQHQMDEAIFKPAQIRPFAVDNLVDAG